MNNKLKIGLLMDSTKIPYWIYSMIEKINQSNYAQINLLIINGKKQTENNNITKIKNNKNYFLYKIYTKFENKIYKQESNTFETYDLESILSDTNKITIIPKQTKYSDLIKEEDIKKIKEFDLDVIVRLGFRILRGGILKAAKCGVWSFHHGDNDINRGGPAGFWEVFEKHPVTGSILQIITEELDEGKILTKSYSTTDPTLVKRNCNNYYMKTLSFLPRKLKELQELGQERFLENVEKENKNLRFYSNRLYTKPTNIEFLRLWYSNFGKFIKRNVQNTYNFEQWGLLFDIKNDVSKSMWRYKKILPPKDRFWADPHIITKDDNYFVFIEEYIYKKSKGHISLIKIDKKGNYKYLGKILEKKYHLSYPFVFEFENNYYMIPETEANKSIELYKCTDFPMKWEYYGKIMDDVSAVDTTIFNYNNKWWMFTGIKENNGASNSDELFLFYSDNPLSDRWIPHGKNPIVSDVRQARPAGKIFSINSKIYRPSQNGSNYYGYGISINQIEKINEKEYEEKSITTILPNWDKNITGVHTFQYDEGLSIIDAKIKRRR
jgi:folate-dependent phosphoribosylglycinamide formyltransferase PurN